MSMSIEQIAAIGSKDFAQVDNSVNTPSYNAPGSAFSDMLKGGVAEVNQTLNSATVQLHNLALDKPVSTHELMVTMEQAKLQLSMAIEVRNKLVEGYQELMRMQL